ncbi:MAG: response regulator transcription factor, partial [Oscillospiraceae bacterium]|nr:response regulator transcription factor [Oscillospiraceae bacterium]
TRHRQKKGESSMTIHSRINVMIVGEKNRSSERCIRLLAPEGWNVFDGYDECHTPQALILNAVSFDMIAEYRRESTIPIIYICKGDADEYSVIMALSKGADAAVAADVSYLELAARIKLLVRRNESVCPAVREDRSPVLMAGNMRIDTAGREVIVSGRSIRMTSLEFGILVFLVRNRGRVCSADEIYRAVWKTESYEARKTVVEHIRRVRKKLGDDPKKNGYIRAVFGMGYIFGDDIGCTEKKAAIA